MLLSSARTSLTTKQIAEKLDMELRTVQRIIKVLPLPIKRDPPGMGGGLRLEQDVALKVPLMSNLVEVAALLVARDKLRESAEGSLIGEAFEQLTERLQQQLKGEQRAICERFVKMYRTKTPPRVAQASPASRTVHKALDEQRVLTIAYRSPTAVRASKRTIEPLNVWVGTDRTYLVARDREKKALRTFALDRIEDAELTDTHFERPPDFDPAAYFAHSLGAFVGDGPVDVVLSLDEEAVRRLGGKLPSPDARLVKKKGGAEMRWRVPLSDELVAWMVPLGKGVIVTAPEKAVTFVREAFSARAKAQS